MNDNEYHKTCDQCGRPMAYCKGQCCGKPQGCQCKEYCGKVCGAIRPGEPKCPYQAVIPSLTVESVSNLKDLADCFVHVSNINTTFYIDDKHRIMTTWAGPVEYNNYDLDDNTLGLRSQFLIDKANDLVAYYDKTGAYQIVGGGSSDDTLRLSVVVEDNAPVYTAGGSVVYDYGGQSPAELITYWLIEGVSFVDGLGTSYTTEDVYNLLADGKKIIFDDVPFGKVPNGYMPVEGFANYPVVSGLSVNARAEDSSYETDSFTGSVSLVFNTAPSPIVHQWGIEKNHIAAPGEEPVDEYYLIASSLLRNSMGA